MKVFVVSALHICSKIVIRIDPFVTNADIDLSGSDSVGDVATGLETRSTLSVQCSVRRCVGKAYFFFFFCE